MKFRRVAALVVLCVLAGAGTRPGMVFAASKDTAKSHSKKQASIPSNASDVDKDAIRSLLSQIAKSATESNARDLSLLWSENGTYVDEDGVESRGRQSIESHLAEAFKQAEKSKIELSPADLRVLSSEHAWVSGITKRTSDSGSENSRFVMLLQKSGGKWTIESASEMAVPVEKTPSQLHLLDWLVGNWAAERGKSKAKMNCEWVGNKSFILCRYTIEEEGKPARLEIQLVGWDPIKEQIVSWHFDANGGFGYGTWVNKDKQWVCIADGVSDGGDRTTATNIITVEDKNKFTWQSLNRKVAGISVPDTELIPVQRVAQ